MILENHNNVRTDQGEPSAQYTVHRDVGRLGRLRSSRRPLGYPTRNFCGVVVQFKFYQRLNLFLVQYCMLGIVHVKCVVGRNHCCTVYTYEVITGRLQTAIPSPTQVDEPTRRLAQLTASVTFDPFNFEA